MPIPSYIYTRFVQEVAERAGVPNIEQDENWVETPRRFQSGMQHLTRGHTPTSASDVNEAFSRTFPTTHQELVMVLNIKAAGLCPHHLLPVVYTVHFGYLPSEQAIGLSKIPRIVQEMCARTMIQEDVTSRIADEFANRLAPKGVGVIIYGYHMCMAIRGVEAREATTVTSAMRGIFLENDKAIRMEFLGFVHNGGQP